MSELEALAGSVLCVGVPGGEVDDGVRAEVEALRPGGLVLFARNVSSLEATRALVAGFREAAGGASPALACVDQEGGRVVRLRFREFALPSMMALGAADDETLAERAGARLGSELRAVGANVDFAPVLDLALDGDSTVVGTRSLGDDPARVAALGAALVRGLQGAGVAAAPKHFPGHGATSRDSHAVLPNVDAGSNTLRARELVPFRAAIAAGARAVMSAHVVFPAFDAEHPATLSRAILTDVLRDELGFHGVCFTDCLQMQAIARGAGSARGAALALAAGADMAVVSNDLGLAGEARDAIVAAVRARELPLARLEDASLRVASLRAVAFEPHAAAANGDEDVAREIARASVAVVRGDPRLAHGAATVISFEGATADGIAASQIERPSLSLALRRRRMRSELMRVALEPDPDAIAVLLDVVRAQGDRSVVLVARRAHLYPLQRRALDALLDLVPGAVVVSALEPFDVPAFARARTVACTFGDDAASIEALADVLCGLRAPRGRLPVALGVVAP